MAPSPLSREAMTPLQGRASSPPSVWRWPAARASPLGSARGAREGRPLRQCVRGWATPRWLRSPPRREQQGEFPPIVWCPRRLAPGGGPGWLSCGFRVCVEACCRHRRTVVLFRPQTWWCLGQQAQQQRSEHRQTPWGAPGAGRRKQSPRTVPSVGSCMAERNGRSVTVRPRNNPRRKKVCRRGRALSSASVVSHPGGRPAAASRGQQPGRKQQPINRATHRSRRPQRAIGQTDWASETAQEGKQRCGRGGPPLPPCPAPLPPRVLRGSGPRVWGQHGDQKGTHRASPPQGGERGKAGALRGVRARTGGPDAHGVTH